MDRACINTYFKDSLDIIQPYTIPIGTILYTGGFSALPGVENPTIYRFYTKNKIIANNFAKTAVLQKKTDVPVVSTFEVIKPIPIYLQTIPSAAFYYDSKEDYASDEAQCLSKDGFHGYASSDPKYEIEDIGLCGVDLFLKQIPTAGKRKKTKRSKRRYRKTYRK